MLNLEDTGKKVSPEDVAELFGVAKSTVLRYPSRYGGVKISGRVLFFEKCISDTIRDYHAVQTNRKDQKPLDWRSTQERTDKAQELSNEARSRRMGKDLQTRTGRASKAHTEDPYGLCA